MITVIRKTFNEKCTIGELLINGAHFAYTLEDVVREDGVKVKGKTAIPEGVYDVILSQSFRFKRVLPELLDVPYFTKIRIHGGNTEADTEGCILVGEFTDGKKIWNCKGKVDELCKILKSGDWKIEVRKAPSPAL